MLRAVLAVLLVVAILAVSQPVVSQGRQDHAATLLRDEVDAVVTAAHDLVRTDEAVVGTSARRIVTVDLPARRRFSAGADAITIEGGSPSTIEWAVDGGATHRRVVEDVRFRTPREEPLRLAGEGERRLLFTLRGSPGDPVVVIDRFDPPGSETDA